jgi:16S rRNA (cytosine967-C5)-methyltransferase
MSARRLALAVLEQVERGGAFATRALDRALARDASLTTADRALATELVYGVLRHQTRLDRALAAHVSRGRGLGKTHPLALRALRLAAYQILMLDRIPAAAAVDEAVTQVRQALDQRRAGFVNAVLRRLADQGEPLLPDPDRAPRDYLVEATSLPGWIADRLLRRFDPVEATRLGDALTERPPVTARVNTLRTNREALIAALAEGSPPIKARPGRCTPEALLLEGAPDPGRSAAHMTGAFTLQDEASQLVSHLFSPAPGERLLDACCGRGGKSLHLAALMACPGADAAGELVAADESADKLAALRQGAERLGAQLPRVIQADLTTPPPSLAGAQPFDGVLLDAPCTGLGVLRRHPEAKWRLSEADLGALAKQQAALLEALAPLVRPGGRLVYGVCTLTREEGPDQVRRFCERHPDFALEAPPTGGTVDWAPLQDGPGPAVQTLPHRHGCDGFFMARLRRLR